MNTLLQKYHQFNSKLIQNKFVFILIATLISSITSFLIFKIIFKNFAIPQLQHNLESFIAIILFFSVIFFILIKGSKLLSVLTIILTLFTIIYSNAITDSFHYTTDELLYDYNYLSYEEALNSNILVPFPKKEKIENAVTFTNSNVRNFSLYSINKHFRKTENYYKYRRFIQYFAIFKEINTRWNYVNDPLGEDYIAKANESLVYFSGDCDDHSILMCSTIKSVGGKMRLIHTGKHMYPELKLSNKKELDEVIFLIKEQLFKKEFKNKIIYYHKDSKGNLWLNMDYTAKHPGGPFLGEKILSILEL